MRTYLAIMLTAIWPALAGAQDVAAAQPETLTDAVLFRIEPEERAPAAEGLSRSLFDDIDRVPSYVLLGILIAIWSAVLGCCAAGSCLWSLPK